MQCSTRDGSGAARPEPKCRGILCRTRPLPGNRNECILCGKIRPDVGPGVEYNTPFRPTRIDGNDLGVIAFVTDDPGHESAALYIPTPDPGPVEALQLDDLRKYGNTFTRIGSNGERERIPPEEVYLGTQSEIGHLDPNETMDDFRRRLRGDPREPEFAADGAMHFASPGPHDDLLDALRYSMAVPRGLLGQAKRVGLFTDPRVHTYAMDWQARIRKLFERNQFLLDVAPALWWRLQRYGHAPIPFNPATWTGAR